jgi:hypothetical protein
VSAVAVGGVVWMEEVPWYDSEGVLSVCGGESGVH